jgi:hypothetical protein
VAGSIARGAGVSARVQIEASRAVTATVVAKRVFMALGPNYAEWGAVEMVDEIAGFACVLSADNRSSFFMEAFMPSSGAGLH